MRILLYMLQYAVIIVVVAAVAGALAREVLLIWAVQQVRSSIDSMDRINRSGDEYDTACRQKGGGRSNGDVAGIQLRFLDDRAYQVEVVCEYFSDDPVIASSHTLPPFVKKSAGFSGLIWKPESLGAIALEVYGRTSSVTLEIDEVRTVQGKPEDIGSGPVTTCSGYGFKCCDVVTQVGADDQILQATDCPDTCFSVCKPRPTVLKLTSDPNPNPDNRTAIVAKGYPITFYYVLDTAGAQSVLGTIDFGDGQTAEITQAEGNITHEYTCSLAICTFPVSVQFMDPETGVQSAITAVSQLTVSMQ